MIQARHRKGFSLVEVMATVAISLVVLAGLANTLRKVQHSVRNAASGSDLSNATRSLAKLMRHDFGNAGRGFGDLLGIEAHYEFNTSFVETETDRDIMYAIDFLDNGGGAVADTSEVVLHYFDYDISASNEGSNPSFLVNMPDGDWPADGNYSNTVQLYSMNQEHLANLAAGDIIFFYKHQLLKDTEIYTSGAAIWNRPEVQDGADHVNNSGAILQLADVSTIEASTDEDLRDMFFVNVTFDQNGSFFTNNFTNNLNNTRFAGYNFTEDLGGALEEEGSAYPSLPEQCHVARKLGDSQSFHRVQYHVEQNSGDDPAVLIRTHNGVREVVATGVIEFIVEVGVDIDPGIQPANVQRENMDGYVSVADQLNWSRTRADYGLSEEDYRTVVGRHAVSVQVSFTQEGLTADRSDRDSTGKKKRGFVEQFRIWNNTLPMSQL